MNKLLDKYFANELSCEERNTLFSALDTDENLRKEFMRLQNTLSSIAYYKGDKYNDEVSEGWKDLIMKNRRRSRRRFVITAMKYAAVVCLTLGLSWYISEVNTSHKEYTEIMSPEGQRTRVMLADGSEVWLSPLSKLKIPTAFNRKVELEGEGFFTVTPDKSNPFIVNTHTYDVKVLGTKFTVFAYSRHPKFEVNLLEGAVFVYNRNDESDNSYLAPREKAASRDGRLTKSPSLHIDEKYIKEGIFNFQSMPVSQILEYLSLWYNINFIVEDSVALSEIKISGKIRQSDRVEHIMEAILASNNTGYKFKMRDEKNVYIYK